MGVVLLPTYSFFMHIALLHSGVCGGSCERDSFLYCTWMGWSKKAMKKKGTTAHKERKTYFVYFVYIVYAVYVVYFPSFFSLMEGKISPFIRACYRTERQSCMGGFFFRVCNKSELNVPFPTIRHTSQTSVVRVVCTRSLRDPTRGWNLIETLGVLPGIQQNREYFCFHTRTIGTSL